MMDPPQLPVTGPDRKRLVYLAVMIFSLFSLLVAQFYRIQVLEGKNGLK